MHREPGGQVANVDGDQSFSEEAQRFDNHARDLISDLTEFDVRKDEQSHKQETGSRPPTELRAWLRLLVLIGSTAALFFAIFVAYFLARSNDSDGVDAESPVVVSTSAAIPAPAEGANMPPGSEPGTTAFTGTGELSGVWEMSWFTSTGDYGRGGFTLVFEGTNSGTINLLNDDYEYDTAFGLDGNDVWFAFTRDFGTGGVVAPPGNVAGRSLFKGSFVGPDEIEGLWIRDDWSCDPDGNCEVTPGKEADGLISYLFRKP